MSLRVYLTSDHEDHVVAESEEDADRVRAETYGDSIASDDPVTWELQPDDRLVTISYEDADEMPDGTVPDVAVIVGEARPKVTLTCGEWAWLREEYGILSIRTFNRMDYVFRKEAVRKFDIWREENALKSQEARSTPSIKGRLAGGTIRGEAERVSLLTKREPIATAAGARAAVAKAQERRESRSRSDVFMERAAYAFFVFVGVWLAWMLIHAAPSFWRAGR